VTCNFSKELLALHVENDLPAGDERIVVDHLVTCDGCRLFLEHLSQRQAQLKSLRSETIHPSAFASMRHEVLSRIESAPHALGWPVRLERALFLVSAAM
jgi:predicted anti-sigma-YlaC factor YlaD